MVTPTIVLELSDSVIKIVVGYVLNNEPVILYATTFSNNGLIENGEIVDVKNLASYLHSKSQIVDEGAHVRFNLNKVVLLLPPTGLKVYEDKRRSVVTSTTKQVSQTDITNVISMMCNAKQDPTYGLIDIVPLLYYIDGGKTDKKPLQCLSTTVGMKALLYTLPLTTVDTYKKTLELANIRISKITLTPNAIASLLYKKGDTPDIYFYVDIGSHLTSVSLINKNHVYASSTVQMGGDLLTKNIATAFSLPDEEAEKLKRRYGYNSRSLSFNPIIYKSKDEKSEQVCFTLTELNKVIKDYSDQFIVKINEAIAEVVSSYPEDKRKYPIIIGGAGSRLAGFIALFKDARPDDDIKEIPLTILGVRHQKYLNAVGALLAEENNMDFIRYDQAKNSVSSRLGALDKKMK